MGRWAQRRRGGGDPLSFHAPLLLITNGSILSNTEIEIEFNGQVSAAGFDPGDFVSEPSFGESVSYVQGSATSVIATYDGNISGDSDGSYFGDKPGIATPQSFGEGV